MASSETRVEQLGAVPLLSHLTPEQLGRLADTGDEQTFLTGETIVRQGEKGEGLFLLLEGTAEVRRSGQKVAALHPGQFFGEAALLVEEPRTADVFATSDVRCFVVRRWNFWGAVGVNPTADQALYEQTVERLKSYQSTLIE